MINRGGRRARSVFAYKSNARLNVTASTAFPAVSLITPKIKNVSFSSGLVDEPPSSQGTRRKNLCVPPQADAKDSESNPQKNYELEYMLSMAKRMS